MSLCEGCDHPRASHYRDVDNVARCMVVETGTSSSGVLGIPWHHACDCVEFVSKETNRRRERKQEEREHQNRLSDEFRRLYLDTPAKSE